MSSKISRRSFIKSSLIAGVSFGTGYLSQSVFRVSNRHDTIIKGATIYDGNGGLPFIGDIAIKDGKIVSVALDLGSSADLVLDAKNLSLSPGFVDLHTHTDTKLLEAPLGDSKIFQGVTTDIGGNCGYGPFPSEKWRDASEFFSDIKKSEIGINYGSFTGQGSLRGLVVGEKDIACTSDQLSAMKYELEKQMEMGSTGLSSGLEYTPGSYASNEELIELCKVVAKYNGLYAIHMRNEDDFVEESIKEALDIAKKSGVRLQISHLKAQNANNWHKAESMLKLIDNARESGVDVAFDRYPYTAFSTGLTSFIPLELRDGSNKEIIDRLENSSISSKIEKYAYSRIARLGGPQNVVITSCNVESNKKFIAKNLEECAQISSVSVWDIIKELLITENLSVSIIGFAMTEDNIKLFLSHPLGMPASDGSVYSPQGVLSQTRPHPRSYGTFPRFIGRYCRDNNWMSLSQAIKKSTSLPASRLNLKNRGLIMPGYCADIVIFDHNKIIDLATYQQPHIFAQGIEHVFVNGAHTISNGEATLLRGGVIV